MKLKNFRSLTYVVSVIGATLALYLCSFLLPNLYKQYPWAFGIAIIFWHSAVVANWLHPALLGGTSEAIENARVLNQIPVTLFSFFIGLIGPFAYLFDFQSFKELVRHE